MRTLPQQARESSSSSRIPTSGDQKTTSDASLEQKDPTLLEQEESILHYHMNNIKRNADLLTKEGDLLAQVQQPGQTARDIDQYATALEEILEQKEDMILALRQQMALFKDNALF